jgi:iron complex outermembrane receptor protein
MYPQPESCPPRRRWHAPLRMGALPLLLAMPAAYAQTQSTPGNANEILEYVIVTGSQVDLTPDYAGGQVARGGRVGLFGNLDMMDTPFNSTNYTADFMRNLQARSVADVVQSDPGVRVARGFGNFQELYVVRGFPVYSDDMSYNGLYGLLPRQYVAAEFLERVEVFRGANSFLNGAAPNGSGLGGSFNLVPKRAPDQPLNRLSAGYENEGQSYLAADFARRFGGFGMRINGVRRDGEMSIDNQERELSMASLGIDYRGDRARFSADFGWQDHRLDAPRPSVTPSGIGGLPRAADASSNFAQNWTFSAEKDFFGVARGEYDVTENTSVWAASGVRDSEEHNVLANPTANGDGSSSAYRFDNYREDRVTTSEIGLRTRFDTGAVGHRLSIQASIFDLDSKNAYALSNFLAGFASNIYEPVQVDPPLADFFTGGVLFDPLTTTRTKTSSAALADTLMFMEERLLVTLGARYQVIEQNTYDYNSGARLTRYDDSIVTPVFAVVVKPSERVSIYGNYAEGLVQGDIVPSVVNTPNGPVTPSNANEILDPFVTKQYEVGAKYDSGALGGTLSVFQVTQPSAILAGDLVRDDGEQRNRGVELTVYGLLAENLRVLGGITALDAEYTRTQFGVNEGNDVIGVPDTQANIGVEWDVTGLDGLSLDGRWVYTSSQAADAANTMSIPSWTRLDLGARYAVRIGSTDVTMRLRVDNVTDNDYWASVGGSFGANYLVLGAPRTFTFSASFDF